MRVLVSAVCILSCLRILSVPAQACAVPKPILYSLVTADAVVQGVFENYEIITKDHVRATIDVSEILWGDIPAGDLSVSWRSPPPPEKRHYPAPVIITLKRVTSQGADSFEIISGCLGQSVYSSDDEQKVARNMLSKRAANKAVCGFDTCR